MTPDELRKLVDEATPGPWTWHEDVEHDEIRINGPVVGTYVAEILDLSLSEEDESRATARLITLAPDLARLCAELGEALERYVDPVLAPTLLKVGEQACAALAKLSELNNGAETPPGSERTQ